MNVKQIFNWIKIGWEYIVKYKHLVYISIIVVLSLLLAGQCSRNTSLNNEVARLENNIYAITDTLTQYQDENGRIIAEKHAYQLTERELRDSVELLKIKNREYLTYINTNIGLKDTIEIPTYVDRFIPLDSTQYADGGTIRFDRFDTFGKSSRELHVSIPYNYTNKLNTGYANVDISHDIYVESMIERDKKTGETYVRLISDYPHLSFNSGMGVLVSNSTSYEKELRKNKGVGIAIGPSVGMSYDLINQKFVPTIGVSVTLGLTCTPKWLQW